jgi:hypothetical protein
MIAIVPLQRNRDFYCLATRKLARRSDETSRRCRGDESEEKFFFLCCFHEWPDSGETLLHHEIVLSIFIREDIFIDVIVNITKQQLIRTDCKFQFRMQIKCFQHPLPHTVNFNIQMRYFSVKQMKKH